MGSSVSIVLDRVEVDVGIGVHPWERFAERPTRLWIDLTLSFEYADYFGKHGGFVSYDPVREALLELRNAPHTDHIETLAARILKLAFDATGAARALLKISKPDIFNEMQSVGVAFDVTRADFEAS